MLAKLKAYLAELETAKNKVLTEDIIGTVEDQVTVYREELLKTIRADQDARIAKIDSDMECIRTLIEREEQLATEEAKTIPVVSGATRDDAVTRQTNVYSTSGSTVV